MITFKVDKVEPAVEALPTCNIKELLDIENHPSIYSENHKDELFVENSHAPSLISLFHMSFSQHRPLILSPDVVWLTIIQGIALHMDKHHEVLRKKFVDFLGQKTLTVTLMELDYSEVISQFSQLVSDETGESSELFRCDFSTTSPDSRIASEIIMLSSFKHYFEMELVCVCGIPEITLKGETEDWEKLSLKLEHFRKYELDWWINKVQPVLSEFIETSKGNINLEFWQNIYKFQEEYNTKIVNGHICLLYPYTKDGLTDMYTNQNPFVLDRSNLVFSSSFPPGITSAPLLVNDMQNTCKMELKGGLLGIKQHKDLCLEALPGWYIQKKPFFFGDIQALKEEFDTCKDLTEALTKYSKQLLTLSGAKGFSIYKFTNSKVRCFYSTIDSHQNEFNENPPEECIVLSLAQWDSRINVIDYQNRILCNEVQSMYSYEPLPPPHINGMKQYALRSFTRYSQMNSEGSWSGIMELINTDSQDGFHPEVLDLLYCLSESHVFNSLESFVLEE